MVDDELEQAIPELLNLSGDIKAVKDTVFGNFAAILEMKAELFGTLQELIVLAFLCHFTQLENAAGLEVPLLHYEAGNQAKCYKAVWRHWIEPEFGICYRTYLNMLGLPPDTESRQDTQPSLFDEL